RRLPGSRPKRRAAAVTVLSRGGPLRADARGLDEAADDLASMRTRLEWTTATLLEDLWRGAASRRFARTWRHVSDRLRRSVLVHEQAAEAAAVLARESERASDTSRHAHAFATDAGCLLEDDGTLLPEVGEPGYPSPIRAVRLATEATAAIEAAEQRAAAVFDALAEALASDWIPEALEPGAGLGGLAALGLAADIAGIADPTPISDGVSGLIDLSHGDVVGAGLAVGSMIPYLGDGAAKPAKLMRKVAEKFPHLRIHSLEELRRTLKHVDLRNLSKVEEALSSLNALHRKAEAAYRNEAWLRKANKPNLPTEGPVPFVPPCGWEVHQPPKDVLNGKKGLLDDFGNVWARGTGRRGDAWEWDVQVVRGGTRKAPEEGQA
ncbi:MAG: polymorphic toxin type 17 domain-containing protein, partial [Actinomycetota bacterium]